VSVGACKKKEQVSQDKAGGDRRYTHTGKKGKTDTRWRAQRMQRLRERQGGKQGIDHKEVNFYIRVGRATREKVPSHSKGNTIRKRVDLRMGKGKCLSSFGVYTAADGGSS